MSEKVGIYLTTEELEQIHIGLGMYSTRLLRQSKKDQDCYDEWKEIVELKRIILRPWKSDRLVSPKP